MTDTITTPDNDELVAEVNSFNKEVLFGALVAAGISKAEMDFDGKCGVGYKESVIAYDADGKEIPIPEISVTFKTIDYDDELLEVDETKTKMLDDAILAGCGLCLEQADVWWYIDKYGTATINVAERKVKLIINTRMGTGTVEKDEYELRG